MTNERRIFITGGASGLGRATALRFASAGWKVCIGDVNGERGKATEAELRRSGADAVYLQLDVTREEDFAAAIDALQARWGGVDVLINNAGVASSGPVEEVPLKDWQWLLDINLMGVVRGCRAFIPVFKQQGHGHIVNVASMAGLIHLPHMASYNAAKAGVVALSETLEGELEDQGIHVTVVCPSFFKTNLHESLRATDPKMVKVMHKLVERSKVTADDVANDIYEAVERPRFFVLPHHEGRTAFMLKRLLPRNVYAGIVRGAARRLRG